MAQPKASDSEHPLLDLEAGFGLHLDLGLGVTDLTYAPLKEVIQPHLPVQLPCYDFVPVTNPTLGRYLPCGLAHGRQVLPTSMT